MEALFIWIENSPLSLWVRGESAWHMAFPIIIVFHALGMGFLVGVALAINGRVLGLAPGVPLTRLHAFIPVAVIALIVNAISGVLLLIGYPTKALTNPVFYIKLLCIALALWNLRWFTKTVLTNTAYDSGNMPLSIKRLAVISTGLWASAIIAGRLLAYTYNHIMSI
ncbi:MAG: hypothetical protein HOG19_14540 [Gammaproteobacteria bacterium]|nr:hypothetical protein [Gammaproteobacteria bacterium]